MRLKSVVLGVAAALAVLALAPQAQAAVRYEPLGSFGSGEMSFGAHLGAVDDATGNVLRIDQSFSSSPGVDVFTTDGSSGTLLTRFGDGEISAPMGLAIDQTSQAVYVSGYYAGVMRYTSDGLPTPTYTRDLTYAGPTVGGGAGEVAVPGAIEIDPRNGDLLIADLSNDAISRFSSSGAFLGSFDGSGAPNGPFHRIFDLAIDAAGDVYVVDEVSGEIHSGGVSVAERYGADGTWKGSLAPATRPFAVAVDLEAGNVLVGNHPAFDASQTVVIDVFGDGEWTGAFAMSAEYDGASVPNLAVDGASGRVYAFATTTSYVPAIQAFAPVPYPDMTVDPPSAVTATSAHISGTIDPLGDEVVYRFEYSPDGMAWESTPDQQLSAPGDPVPTGPVAVEADLAGLSSNREYQVRLSVTTARGRFESPPVSFETDPASPGVVTGRALDRTPTGATLRGTVDPFGLQATYHFEYGTTAAYGSRAPAARDAVVGGEQGVRHVAQVIEGLQPGTTYHYRLVATSSHGTRQGADRTFTTSSAGEVLGYEQVSPVEKGSSNVAKANVQSAPSGEAVAFEWVTAPGGTAASESAPAFPRSVAWRSPSAWTAFAMDPPQTTAARNERLNLVTTVMAVSRDGRKALVTSYKALAPGAVEGNSNIYVRDVATGAYTTVVTNPDRLLVNRAQHLDGNPYVDGTSDWSHLLIAWPHGSLVPGDPVGALYDWTGGELHLVSIDPAGNELGGVTVGGGSQNTDHGSYPVSEDGSRIPFSTIENFSPGPVYLRIDGTETIPLSVSERVEDAAAPLKSGRFVGATADGRYVYFSTDEPLTDDAGGAGLYEFDVDERELTVVATGVDWSGVWQVAARNRTVYFGTSALLAPEDQDSDFSLYVWRAGQLSYIAPGRVEEFMASPSGRYLAFTSYIALTDYDTATTACNKPGVDYQFAGNACRAAYRYDTDTGELLCASCRPDGERLTGNAVMGKELRSADWGGHYFSRAVTDDGMVFFDTPDPLSATDVNSARDVYAFDGEQATLISTGTGDDHSRFGDASADGRSVFFTTEDKLVGQDDDTSVDLYVARLGGGLPSQDGASSVPAPCDQGCQDADRSSQGRQLPSATLRPRGNAGSDRPATARFAKLSASVRARLARTGRARIEVRVGGAGRVSVLARARLSRRAVTVARGSTVAKRAGTATVTLRLTRAARRALATRGKLTLRLSMTLAGRPTAKARLDLRRPPQARRATAPTTTNGR